ncbi:ATP-binding protein [Pedococcus sp. KACC 23699]|uniref:histidine kinase n=1 Tax=Pedococcus sp. KACC 23699 TaxID=3149228 RepID=A0AAU7JWG2_9MICO
MNGWLERWGLRTRLMALGLVGVTGALVVGGLLLYAATGVSLERATVAEARSNASDVAALVNDGRLPEPVPVSGAQVVQVLDAGNRVVGGSVTADRLTPLINPQERRRLLAGGWVTVPGSRAGLGGELVAVAVLAGPAGNPSVVVAAVPTADLETSRRVLRTLMLVFFPVFLALLAFTAWRVIGYTLRPVERLRQGAERIGESADPSERLPLPTAHDELWALATTLNGMLERLSVASAKQRDFVSDAAHELRSPLASLQTQLEVAGRLGDGGTLPAELLPDLHRLSALVEDLLVLARSGPDAAPPRREPLDLSELLTEVEHRYAAARVPVRVHQSRLDGGVRPVVSGSRTEVSRAVTNLVDNAVRHARTCVVVRADVHGDAARLVVQDDGNGVPPQERERVFDRFARLEEARDRDSGGSGLGLPITRELLRRNGARVWLEDAAPGLRAVVQFDRLAEQAG